MAKPNNNKNYFERSFGPKRNPKAEKQADARLEKKMKKDWSASNENGGWEHQDKFDKGNRKSDDRRQGDGGFKRSSSSERPSSFRRNENDNRDDRRGGDKPSFKRSFGNDNEGSFKRSRPANGDRDGFKSRPSKFGDKKEGGRGEQSGFKRSFDNDREGGYKGKRSSFSDNDGYKSRGNKFDDKRGGGRAENSGFKRSFGNDKEGDFKSKRSFDGPKDGSKRPYGNNDESNFKRKRSFEGDNEGTGSRDKKFGPRKTNDRYDNDKQGGFKKGGVDRKRNEQDAAPRKKFGQDIFAKEKKKENEFYSDEDRERLFGTEAFKDRVLKELEEEIQEDFDEIKKKKAIDKKNESRAKRESKRESEDYRITKYIDDESEYEKAYESVGGKKWVVEGSKEDVENSNPAGESMPLNKYLAHCGVCSRRDAVSIIKNGKIAVDGVTITEPGFKVIPTHQITMDGKKLQVQKNLVYILMNKPKGFITTTDDPKGRKTVMDMVENHIEERVFPVGRLDRNTTGLLLLTNDGDLAQQLAHPKYEIRKIYHVVLDKNVSKADFDKILNGVELEDGVAQVDHLAYLDAKNEIGIEIHSGKNRIVRRIFESCGYVVDKLDRVMYAGLTKKNLPRGKFRLLAKQEVINLKHFGKK